MQLGCRTLYTVDEGMKARQTHLAIKGIQFLEPVPRGLDLNFGDDTAHKIN